MKQKFEKSGFDKQRLQTAIEVFDNFLGSIREPLLVLDSDLKVVKANPSFYQTFNVKPDETEGILIYDLGNRQTADREGKYLYVNFRIRIESAGGCVEIHSG